MRLLNIRGDVSKIIPNSLIFRNNHELDSIVVNNGRIHGELRYFFRCSSKFNQIRQ